MASGSVPESGIELTTVRSAPGSATISGEEWWGALGSGQISSTTRAITSQSAGPRVSENGCLRLISDSTTTQSKASPVLAFFFSATYTTAPPVHQKRNVPAIPKLTERFRSNFGQSFGQAVCPMHIAPVFPYTATYPGFLTFTDSHEGGRIARPLLLRASSDYWV